MTEYENENVEKEAAQALRSIFWGIVSKKGGTRESMTKEFDSVLAQIFGDHGGSERFTNLRSPGMPPGKIPATPGRGGTSGVTTSRIGDRPRGLDREGRPSDYGQQHPDAYDSTGEYSQADPNKDNGEAFVGRDTQHPAYPELQGGGSILKQGLAQFEKERHTEQGISPGTMPLTTPTEGADIQALKDKENDEELDQAEPEAAIGQTSKPEFEAQVARREAMKPTLVRRDVKGVGSKDVRKTYHQSYTGEQ